MRAHRPLRTPLLVALLFFAVFGVALFVVSASASAASAGGEADAWTTSNVLTTEDRTFVSQSGTEIVGTIDEARAALDRGDYLKARYQTAKARSALAPLRAKSPTLRLQDRIASALESVRSGSKPRTETLLPIYAELDTVSDTEYASDVRAYVDKARAGAKGGDAQVVEDSLVQASARLRYLEIDLPIEETYSRLSRALMQIDSKQLQGAKQTLAEAEDHISSFVEIASTSDGDDTEAVGSGPE